MKTLTILALAALLTACGDHVAGTSKAETCAFFAALAGRESADAQRTDLGERARALARANATSLYLTNATKCGWPAMPR